METLLGLSGTIGVIFLLLGYYLLVIGQLKATDTHHIMLNLLGALLIVLALHVGQSVPLTLAITGWLFISIFGWYKHSSVVAE